MALSKIEVSADGGLLWVGASEGTVESAVPLGLNWCVLTANDHGVSRVCKLSDIHRHGFGSWKEWAANPKGFPNLVHPQFRSSLQPAEDQEFFPHPDVVAGSVSPFVELEAEGKEPTLFGLPIKFTEDLPVWRSRPLDMSAQDVLPFAELDGLTPSEVEAATGAYHVSQEFIDKLNEAEKPCVRCGGCGKVVDLDGGGFSITAPASDHPDLRSRACPDCSVYKMEWVWRNDGSPSWWCGCGLLDHEGGRRDCLRDFLNAFSPTVTVGDLSDSPPYCYVNLKEMDKVRKRWTPQAIDVIAYLLDAMGYTEHSGSVCCSQWLTPEGERLRVWANDENWEGD